MIAWKDRFLPRCLRLSGKLGSYQNSDIVCVATEKQITAVQQEVLLRVTYANRNFVKCYGFTLLCCEPFLVTERTAHSLRYYIEVVSFSRFRPTSILYMSDCAKALQYLHSIDSNFVHKTLTMESFDYSTDGYAKLKDLGHSEQKLIQHGDYVAPEISQIVEGRIISQAVDICSLAIIFLEMLHPNERSLIWIHHLMSSNNLGSSLSQLLLKMSAKDPFQRPTVHDVVADLDVIFYHYFKDVVDKLNIEGVILGSSLVTLLLEQNLACNPVESLRLCYKLLDQNIIKHVAQVPLLSKKMLKIVSNSGTNTTTTYLETTASPSAKSSLSSLEMDLSGIEFDLEKYYKVNRSFDAPIHLPQIMLPEAKPDPVSTPSSIYLGMYDHDRETVISRETEF
jgi:serine/threonine protein kinase